MMSSLMRIHPFHNQCGAPALHVPARLTAQVEALLHHGDYARCAQLLRAAMYARPDAAQPHNLMGVMLEYQHRYADAMKHYRAALALEPELPAAKHNLERLSGADRKNNTRIDFGADQPGFSLFHGRA